MATIQSQLRLNDGMTSVLRSITAAFGTCLSSFEQMQAASRQAMDIESITAARVGLSEANAAIEQMENNLHQVEQQQNGVNRSFQAGHGAVDGLLGKIKQMALAAGAGIGLQKIMGLSDDMTELRARLGFIVDDGGSVADLEAKIFASAQRTRASYQTTADVISKLGMQAGDAFANNDELIAFSEQLNKTFVIAGANGQAVDSVMYNLTQALSSGVLRGQDLNSVMSNAMPIVQNIADYLGVSVGEIRDMAADGQLSAGVIKNSMFAAAEDTNAAFGKMPKTWGQIWTGMGNQAIVALDPLLQKISALANDPRAQTAADGIIGGLNAVVAVAVPLIDMMVNGAAWVADNWGIIAPVLLAIAAALAILHGAQMAYNVVQGISNGLAAVKAARTAMTTVAVGAETTATFAATAAQYGFNAALLACPLTWILLIIIAVIAAIYGIVAAYNKWTDSTVSATGIVFGLFFVLGARLYNLVIVPLWNAFASIANFFGNVFNDPVAAIKILFYDMVLAVIGYFLTLARGIETLINKIPGLEVDITSGLDNFYKSIEDASQKVKDESGWIEYVKKLDYMDYGDAFNKGYAVGEGVENSVKDFFNNVPGDPDEPPPLPEYQSPLKNIEDNTGSTAASLKNMSEDLVYMRDLAEREVVNRFTTAEIKVDMSGMTNRVENNTDIDGVVKRFTDGITEALDTAAEGVHK